MRVEGDGGGGGNIMFSQPPKPLFYNSPALSLALGKQAGMMGVARRSREDAQTENSRSGSGDIDGPNSPDDFDGHDFPPRKKRYHRHTPHQIQELESLFKECPHPDEKQRSDLSRRLSLNTRQVKFWFQNRRTQMKTQLERHENSILRQENDNLRSENMSMRNAMRNPICTSCGGPAIIDGPSFEEQTLRIENARLKDGLDRVSALTGKFIGRPISTLENIPMLSELGCSISPTGNNGIERSTLIDLALRAMEEFVKMAESDEPLWRRDNDVIVLNREEYTRAFRGDSGVGAKPSGIVTEASRESGMVIINSLALVETLMDSNRWAEMFPCMIARTSTTDVISSGVGGTRNGALQMMHAELQVLSPLVPFREVKFLRFCKQHGEGVWAVVDVSIDRITEYSGVSYPKCRRLPSGCLVQDMPNGYSKVTCVEHVEYDESTIHHLYRQLIGAGMGFGAQRWISTLQRQCQGLAIIISSTIPSPDHSTAITATGRRSMLKLAQRMTDNFCAGVCASSVHKWNRLCSSNVDEDVRVMTRKSVNDPGEPPGIVLSAATSLWLPISPERLFDFLRNERFRSQWDILSNGGPMQEMAHIAKGQDHGNSVSLLRATAMNPNQSSMLILQETWIDASGSLVVYAPVDIPAMHVVMNGGDSAYVALLPSGFSIVPDGPNLGPYQSRPNGGSLLTVGFQILVNSLPTARLTVESVETVSNLISCTVQKIRAALQCQG